MPAAGLRAIDSVSALAGKRVSTIDFDQAAKVLIDNVGASMVAADAGTFSGMFNNGSVDACPPQASHGAHRSSTRSRHGRCASP